MTASGVDVAIVKDIAELLSVLCDDDSSQIDAEAFATSPVVQSTSWESISNSAAVKLVADGALRPYQSPGRIATTQTLTELKLDGFESAEKVHAYRVGHVTWATCRIRWKLTLSIETLGLTVDDTPVVVPPIALSFVVPSTVLARMDNDVLEAEVLDTGGPLRVEPASPA